MYHGAPSGEERHRVEGSLGIERALLRRELGELQERAERRELIDAERADAERADAES